MSQLLKAYKAASKQAHVRNFDVGGGEKIAVPRLSLANQAQLEQRIRKDDPKFNLALIRNRAAMAMAECVEGALKDLREKGVPEHFSTQEQERMWRSEFQAHLLGQWMPYSESLFQSFTREHMVFGLVLALKQLYGPSLDNEGTAIPVDNELVGVLFPAGNTLESAFLWAAGLVDVPEDTSPDTAVKSLDDLVTQVAGGPLADSEKPEDTSSTTESSQSSTPSTESGSTRFGD